MPLAAHPELAGAEIEQELYEPALHRKAKPLHMRSFRVQKTINTRSRNKNKSDYGYFQLKQRFRTGQAPLSLDNASGRTFCPQGTRDQPLISGQASGNKRFCSLQISMHADPTFPQPKIGTPTLRFYLWCRLFSFCLFVFVLFVFF